ncbi:hypothetical protein GCM10027161_71780 [Microbispora hainanensis]
MIPKLGRRECGMGMVLSPRAARDECADGGRVEREVRERRMAWSQARCSGIMSKRDRVPF